MRFLSLIVLTFVIIIGITFSILNSQVVVVHYYVGAKEVPLSILMLVVWVFGVLIGVMTSYPKILALKLALRRHQQL